MKRPTLVEVLCSCVALMFAAPVAAGADTPSPDGAPAADATGKVPGDPPASLPPKTEPRNGGLIPGVLFGPKVSAAVLFPPNVTVGLELRLVRYLGASFEYRGLPRDRAISDYDLRIDTTWSAGVRVHPFGGAFFLGAVLGDYDVTASEAVGPDGQLATLNVAGTYLGPQVGWKGTSDTGLFLGLHLGYGFSVRYSSTLTRFDGDAGDLETARDEADRYLKSGVPVFTLLELGWML